MARDPSCLFCKVVAGELPATIVRQDDAVTAFRDINPQMATHVLVVPNDHIADTDALQPADDELVGRLVRAAAAIARDEGVAATGYRLVVNTGADALNSVPHLHLHLLGGRRMGWPPG
jgi:histidine triad (HIT) family protein